jgi:hypothetical protein
VSRWSRVPPVLVLLSVGFGSAPCHADDALVLPRGIGRATADALHYFPIRERYDPDGKVEDVAVDYNRPLDSRVFTLLAPLNPLVGGRASIGDSVVSYEYRFTILDLGLQYGVTDRLTAGIRVPYWWVTNKVGARLDSGPGSSANVGLNLGPGPAVIPIAFGGIPFTTEDVQQLLGPGLRGIPGFGYKRVETWSDDGFSDIEAGFKYQFWRGDDVRAATGLGTRFPTGRVDDPDNLVDYEFGTGTYAVLFRLYADYTASNLWRRTERAAFSNDPTVLAPGDLVLNGTFRYDWVLPDRQDKRVPDAVDNPITRNREIVDRDLGDRFEFETSAKYAMSAIFWLTAVYRYAFKLEDEVSGKRGFAYRSLEEETAASEHVYFVGLTFSTVPFYQQQRFPVPLHFSVYYRDRFAGSNNALKSRFLGAGIQVFF